MSAFIVEHSHINAILKSAFQCEAHNRSVFRWYHNKESHELNINNADEVGQMLLDECVNSVQFRYSDSPRTDLPGRSDGEYLLPFKYRIMGKQPKVVEALKLIHCYEYQSCEHPEWNKSSAKDFCQSLKESLIMCLPGYEDALWEWEEVLPTDKVTRLV